MLLSFPFKNAALISSPHFNSTRTNQYYKNARNH